MWVLALLVENSPLSLLQRLGVEDETVGEGSGKVD
jgi:hypothetical protein